MGLGKTLVARGLITCAIDHLWDKVDRIDIVYICSNADIARQNVKKLKIPDLGDFPLSSRITMLPTRIHDLQQNRVNLISFTPGTSFDLQFNMGRGEERALLYLLLEEIWDLRRLGVAPLKVLQGTMRPDRFKDLVNASRQTRID